VEFRILGPLEVADGGRIVDLGGPRERVLLARLLISANLVVSADRLAEDLWPAEPPAHWLATLRVYVSRLRRALGPGAAAVLTEPPGYRLRLAAGQLDADTFERLTAAARRDLAEGRPEAAAAGLRQALGLWRGPALSGAADLPFARADAARLEEARLGAVEDWVEAELGCGHHAGMAAELDGLVTSHPLRERLRGQRMRALYRCGRQADALRAYRELRAYLGEELGLEPAAALRELESAILRQDPALDWRAPPPAASPAPPAPAPPGTAVRPAGLPGAGRAAGRLPAETTSFIGREADLAAVGKLLTAGRLVTLTGPGGSGKTRLARQAGAATAGGHPGRVWLADLAPVGGPELAAPAVAAALAVREEPGRPLADSIAARLGDSDALLIVDNCEHVAGAAAELIAALLAACPALRILATSQARLGVPGEAIWPVPPLSVPLPAERDPAAVAGAESVRLLCDRAALARPGFSLTAGNAADIGEVCRRLDGIPLAIELAAARLSTLTPAQLAARLGDRFRVLTGGSRTELARHRTLRAAISWSHELLDQLEQVCFRRMAVFAGGCTIEAAEAVFADASLPAEAVLETVTSLVDRSLLTIEERCGAMRYGMLESVRQYAREQLIQAGEDDQLSRRHLAWLLDLAGRADLDGADQSAWLDLLEADHDNFRAALERALAARQAGPALALAGALAAFWVVRGHIGEGRRWAGAALGAATAHDDLRARAAALDGAAQLAFAHADFQAERDFLQESLGLWRELDQAAQVAQCLSDLGVVAHIRGEPGTARSLLNQALESARLAADQRQIAMALNGLGRLFLQDDPPQAAAYLEESLACIRQTGDLRRATIILGNLAVAAINQGQTALARARMEEQLASARQLGDRKLTGWALTNLGNAAAEAGDLAAARARQDEALRLAQEIGDRRLQTYALTNRGVVCQADGDYPAARTFHQRSLQLALALGEPHIIAAILEDLAHVEAADANPALAARLLGAAHALRERLSEPVPSPDLARHNQVTANLQKVLGDEHYQAAWDQGQSMPEQQAITLAAATPGLELPPTPNETRDSLR
jgi:predicted ATPase/DNA-binding SARP family transcriptional activator